MATTKKATTTSPKSVTQLRVNKQKTFSAKPTDITRQWYLLDASETVLGKLSVKAASLLLGKAKPVITPHVDCGDFVVIINADQLKVTGNKTADKKYYRHSQYPGNLKTASLSEKMAKNSAEVVHLAVRGMLPKNKLLDGRLKRLKIYRGEEHNNQAQKPQKVSVN